jgi:hypothetical protein
VYSSAALLVWGGTGVARHEGRPGTVAPVPSGSMTEGEQYFLQCRYADDDNLAYLDSFVYQPGVPDAGPRVDAIARQVYEEVPLAYPVPHTSPSPDMPQLVGFPVWLWVDDGVWRTFDASASVAGVSVSVVAQPREVRWDMGDGTTVTCGQGSAWNPDGPADQNTDCDHVYQFVSDDEPNGRYAASVTVVWSVSWSASTGESGTLPDASRTTTFELDVTERQAVITYGTDS